MKKALASIQFLIRLGIEWFHCGFPKDGFKNCPYAAQTDM